MCGIFAAMTRQPLRAEHIQAALNVLGHRGPDGAGIWTSGDLRLTLGHTRLSIIGLNNGRQPMASSDGHLHMVVNGEFYGYREIREQLRNAGAIFQTESDSEIALHLYQRQGLQVTSALRGEFAVVIADERNRSMIAIRDRFGIKPLFYTVHKGDVYFASEIKALLALGVPAAWDYDSVHASIAQSHENTYFKGIHTVPQGCYAIAKDGNVRIYPYWDWEIPTAEEMRADKRSEDEVISDFREVLTDAVRQRLVADVEVGCYLSGGIDSCAVLGLAQREMDRPINAYTLTFGDPLYNEAAIAEKQAAFVGASYHPIPITSRDIADNFANAIWHSEAPMFNGHGVAKYLLSQGVRDAGIKVVFTGEGSDEMLGGYSFFRADAVLGNPALSDDEKSAMIAEIFGANEATRSLLMPEKTDDPDWEAIQGRLGWQPETFGTYIKQVSSQLPYLRDGILNNLSTDTPLACTLDRLPLAMRVKGRNRLNQSLYLHSKIQLPNLILNYLGDRMEMAHSIEGRVPFLDHHVAECAARVPVDMKVKGIREKHVLREATKDVLIPEVYDRQKHPFTTPPTRNKNDPMMTLYRDTFASAAAKAQPVYDPNKIDQALDDLMTCAPDQSIAMEGIIQRIASVILMQEKFQMTDHT
jgi:asparagine synthase (glutamine-hydrolysing)